MIAVGKRCVHGTATVYATYIYEPDDSTDGEDTQDNDDDSKVGPRGKPPQDKEQNNPDETKLAAIITTNTNGWSKSIAQHHSNQGTKGLV